MQTQDTNFPSSIEKDMVLQDSFSSPKDSIQENKEIISPGDKDSKSSNKEQTDLYKDIKNLGIIHGILFLIAFFTGMKFVVFVLVIIGGMFSYNALKGDLFNEMGEKQFKSIINFELSFILYTVLSALSIFLLVGLLIFPIVIFTWIIIEVIGFIKNYQGEFYEFPFTIKFIK